MTARVSLRALGEAMDRVADEGGTATVLYRERSYQVALAPEPPLSEQQRYVWTEVAAAPAYFFRRVAFGTAWVRRMNRWFVVEDQQQAPYA